MDHPRSRVSAVPSHIQNPSRPVAAATEAATHQAWPDVAKGVGIILVVFGHAWRGLHSSGIVPDGRMFQAVDAAVYAFHMPLFFFLSGWFFPKTLQARPEGTLLLRVGQRILYPMCVWTYLFIALQMVAGGDANIRVQPSDFLRLPVPPYLHLWFLWALGLIQIVTILLRPVALRNQTLFFGVMTAISIAVLLANIVPYTPYLTGVLPSAPYFFLGALWGLLGSIPKSGLAVLIAVLAFIGAEALVVGGIAMTPLVTLVIAIVCVVSLLCILRGTEPFGGGAFRVLAMLGGYSMAIYLMHTVFSSAARILLVKVAGIHDMVIHLIVGVAAGVLLPLLIYSRPIPGALRLLLLGQDQKARSS